MRDRLIKLLTDGQPPFNPLNWVCIEKLADYLLANGVIAPPCKLGDTVYWISTENPDTMEPENRPRLDEIPIQGILITKDAVYVCTHNIQRAIDECDEVNTPYAYLSYEEAERALQRKAVRSNG